VLNAHGFCENIKEEYNKHYSSLKGSPQLSVKSTQEKANMRTEGKEKGHLQSGLGQ